MDNKKHTAVNLLEKKVYLALKNWHEKGIEYSLDAFTKDFNDARQQEKEQTIDVMLLIQKKHYNHGDVWPPQFVVDSAEKTFNETFLLPYEQ